MARVFVCQVRKVLPVALSILASTLFGIQASAETLIVQGSTTFARRLMEPLKDFIESNSQHELTIIPNKSLPGLIALMEGRAQMAMISAPLETEVKALQKNMPGLSYDRLKQHEIVKTRIAFAIHPSNRVRKASLNQVRKILLNEITNWREVGGVDLPIRIVVVGGGGGVTTVVETELLGGQRVEGRHVIFVKTPVHLVQVIEQEPGAIGFAQLALTQQRGLPELVTEQPIEQTLSLITLGDPTPAMNDVIQAARRAAEKLM